MQLCVRKASQQTMRAVVVMWSHWKATLIGNLPFSAFASFTEVVEVGRREAASFAAMFQWSVSLADWHPFTRLQLPSSRNWFDCLQ